MLRAAQGAVTKHFVDNLFCRGPDFAGYGWGWGFVEGQTYQFVRTFVGLPVCMRTYLLRSTYVVLSRHASEERNGVNGVDCQRRNGVGHWPVCMQILAPRDEGTTFGTEYSAVCPFKVL